MQRGGIVGLVSILDGRVIYRLVPEMRGLLGARGRWVLKFLELMAPMETSMVGLTAMA